MNITVSVPQNRSTQLTDLSTNSIVSWDTIEEMVLIDYGYQEIKKLRKSTDSKVTELDIARIKEEYKDLIVDLP